VTCSASWCTSWRSRWGGWGGSWPTRPTLGEYDDGGDGEEAPYHRAFEEGFRFTGLSDPTAGDRLDPHAVESVMTPSAFSVRSTDPVSEAAAFMMRGRIHRALVVDDGRLVGIVTPFDLLRLLATEHSRAATV
jgi:hypothetical protein